MLLLLLASALAAEPRHLTADAALALLEAQNPALRRAEADLRGARGGALVAASGLLPSVTGTGTYVRNNEEVVMDLTGLLDALSALMGQDLGGPEGPLVLQPLDALSGTATVRVPLVNAAGWASLDAAHRATDAGEAGRDALRSSLRATAWQAFHLEAAAEARVGVMEASVARARALVGTAERAVAAGTAPRLELLQAQTELARREGELLTARAGLEKARAAVGALLGEPGPVAVELGPLPAVSVPDPDALVDAAWSARPEARAADAQVDAARAQLLAVRLGALPTVSGSVSGFASTEPYSTGEKTGWRASVDLTWPLLQGGLREGQEGRALAGLDAAEAGRDATRLQVAQQVRDATADLAAAAARVEVTARQRALAEEAATVAERSHAEGLVDADAVLDALDRVDQARLAEVDARARLGAAEAALRAATGRW